MLKKIQQRSWMIDAIHTLLVKYPEVYEMKGSGKLHARLTVKLNVGDNVTVNPAGFALASPANEIVGTVISSQWNTSTIDSPAGQITIIHLFNRTVSDPSDPPVAAAPEGLLTLVAGETAVWYTDDYIKPGDRVSVNSDGDAYPSGDMTPNLAVGICTHVIGSEDGRVKFGIHILPTIHRIDYTNEPFNVKLVIEKPKNQEKEMGQFSAGKIEIPSPFAVKYNDSAFSEYDGYSTDDPPAEPPKAEPPPTTKRTTRSILL